MVIASEAARRSNAIRQLRHQRAGFTRPSAGGGQADCAYHRPVRTRGFVVVCLMAAGVMSVIALWLLLDNQSAKVSAIDIGQEQSAGRVGCTIAPWDAGFNHNDAGPGGEHSVAYVKEVGEKCYTVNVRRFRTSIAAGLLGLVLVSTAVAAKPKASAR